MNWKDQLREFEHSKHWDDAIKFMQKIIIKNPDNIDAYLSMNFLLMNLLVEEDYERLQHDYYTNLLKKYFIESYSKFYSNPEYLFYTGITACMSEWYFNINIATATEMIQKSMHLEPINILYQWGYYCLLDLNKIENTKKAKIYAELILKNDSPIQAMLNSKGALGQYLSEIMINWSKDIYLHKTNA